MLNFILNKIVGTQNERTVKKLLPIVEEVNIFEPAVSRLSNAELRAKTDEFKEKLKKDATLDDILPEAFAVVREAGKRTVNMRHFDVQILGGIVLHKGKISEMATGEGKTLVATLSVYLNALTGKGVHVVTVNDYLAKRDCGWMGPIYDILGLSVSSIGHELSLLYDTSFEDNSAKDERTKHLKPITRKEAYQADITYGTNNEFGFDYLRDNMVVHLEDMVQRGFYYAIVDEVDSILVDEARTPLIISGPAEESTDKYYKIDKIIPRLSKEVDYQIDEKAHTAALTEEGIRKAEGLLNVGNLYDPQNMEILHHVNQALKAHTLFRRDVDYMIKDGQVIIVDEFTGRLMPGRRWSDGLHQAVEAKEGATIERENQTLATITFQNYFRMYEKLAGMTGTAATEAGEFHEIYKLDVVTIPTNRHLLRTNHPDVIYRTEREKFNAVINEISELYRAGRPVLVGTISIEKSERVSTLLRKRNIPHEVLNAKYHELEAQIIAKAGQKFAVTISTNMAGRGTDIVLGEGVAELGGLHVLGTERHEARRIDNQLRGRSGRQGDAGSSRFYLALEDDLMRIFGSDRISGIMQRLGMEEGQDIQHPLVTRSIEVAQKRVEEHNFEIRKHLLEYDDVMNRQREIIYGERRQILEGINLKERLFKIIEELVDESIETHFGKDAVTRDYEGFAEWARNKFGVNVSDLSQKNTDAIIEEALKRIEAAYNQKEERFGVDAMRHLEKMVMLHIIDARWKEHLYSMDDLKEGIGLRGYGQKDPLVEYKHEGFAMFDDLIQKIKEETVEFVLKVQPVITEGLKSVFASVPRQFIHQDVSSVRFSAPPQEAAPSRYRQPSEATPPDSMQMTYKREAAKVGRNDPCPCGSGFKYKKCCGK
ncbi:MAG: preprotein translocase subunit SecA [Candidatus Omnitrophica bacterium]|nr:preprotein translocase subunit SecA [Candidatus Omnitrophota bacterium]